MKTEVHLSAGRLSSSFWTYTVLPVPVGPTKSTGFPCARRVESSEVYRAVSSVGTMICANSALAGMVISPGAIVSIHRSHLRVDLLRQYS